VIGVFILRKTRSLGVIGFVVYVVRLVRGMRFMLILATSRTFNRCGTRSLANRLSRVVRGVQDRINVVLRRVDGCVTDVDACLSP
jgi:hypothetical protein